MESAALYSSVRWMGELWRGRAVLPGGGPVAIELDSQRIVVGTGFGEQAFRLFSPFCTSVTVPFTCSKIISDEFHAILSAAAQRFCPFPVTIGLMQRPVRKVDFEHGKARAGAQFAVREVCGQVYLVRVISVIAVGGMYIVYTFLNLAHGTSWFPCLCSMQHDCDCVFDCL